MTAEAEVRRETMRPSVARPAERTTLLALAAITALAFGLRVPGMDQSLYGDEFFTHTIITRHGPGGVWSAVYHTSITPPLHYYLAWIAVQFGGDSTVLIRLPSLILGTATVPLVFLIARRIAGARAGLLAALLLALSPFAIWYSDEGRAYATMMFLLALSTFALLRAVDGSGRRWWVVYSLSACAALWSHYTAAFVIIVEAVWGLWACRDRWRPPVLAAAGIVLLYLPWLPGFLAQRQNHTGIEIINAVAPLSFGVPFSVPLRTLVGHPFFGLRAFPGTTGLILALVVAALVVAVAVTVPARRRVGRSLRSWRAPSRLGPMLRSEFALLVLLALATPAGLLVYAASGTSLFIPRNLSASLPALAVVVAVLLAWLSRAAPRSLGAIALAGVIALLGVNVAKSTGDHYRRTPFREAARYLDRVAAAGAPVVEVQVLGDPRSVKLPTITLDLYFQRPHPLYRAGFDDAIAWRGLRAGKTVYVVAPKALTLGAIAKTAVGGAHVPAALLRRFSRLGGSDGRAIDRGVKYLPGIIPIAVWRYRGVVRGQVMRHHGRETISWSFGPRLTVSPGVAEGAVTGVSPSRKPLIIGGWTIAADRPRLVDWILFFSRGRLFAVSPGGGGRPAIARVHGPSTLLSGFGLAPTPAPSNHAGIRVFAVVGNRASELPFSAAAMHSLRIPRASPHG